MKGIILAAGKGTRLHPVTLEIPKPLITIKGRPLINFSVELFSKYGVNEIAIIIRPSDREHYRQWHERYAPEFPDASIAFFEENEEMGTLGYIFHRLSDWIDGQAIFVMNGDGVIQGIDLNEMTSFHRDMHTKGTIAITKVEDSKEYGSVIITDNKVSAFLEKSADIGPGWASAGLYIISPVALAHIKDAVARDKKYLMFEKDLFPVLANDGELAAFTSDGKFYDCGTFERWAKAIREL